MPFLRPMYPMLGVQSGLCSHNNPIEQFLSEPRGRRLLLAEVEDLAAPLTRMALGSSMGREAGMQMDALAESRSWDKLEEKAAVTHPSTSRHGHPQKTSSALIRFDPLKMQYCAVGVLESHNDYNEIHRRLTSRHVLDMFGSHASLSDSHPSSFLPSFHSASPSRPSDVSQPVQATAS